MHLCRDKRGPPKCAHKGPAKRGSPKCAHIGPSKCHITQDGCAHWPFNGGCAQQKLIRRRLWQVKCAHFGERRRNERLPTKACLPRHGPFAHPVCVAARKPPFRPGNPPRHVRSGTSVCAATSGAKRILRSNYLSDNFVIISIISTFAPCE